MSFRTKCDRTTKTKHAQAARDGKPMTWQEARRVAVSVEAKAAARKAAFEGATDARSTKARRINAVKARTSMNGWQVRKVLAADALKRAAK